nr:ADP-ribosylation factor-like protein 6-interacting protein 6 isoform X1 [Parasteatoda tepidariorum]
MGALVKTKDAFSSANLLLTVCAASLLVYVSWELLQSSLFQILKSVFGGILLVYYSWEIIYFDSMMPGIQPASPLSPSPIKKISGPTLHLNYTLAVVIGVFFTLFINWYT